MPKFTKRSAAITATAAVVGLGAVGGAAYAAGWLVEGTGSVQATTSTVTPMTATVHMGGVKLFPGLTTTVQAKVTSDNDFPVVLKNEIEAAGLTVSGPKAEGCKASLQTTPGVVKVTVPPNTKISRGAVNQAVNVGVVIGDLSQDCADSIITLNYKFSGTSSV